MKTLLIAIVTGIVGLGVLPTQVDAKPQQKKQSNTYRSGYTAHTKKVIKGYDRHRNPIYVYYNVPVKYNGGSSIKSSSYRPYSSNYSYSSSRRGYSNSYRSYGYSNSYSYGGRSCRY